MRWRPENDKSQFLAKAGYTPAHAIRHQLLPLEAAFEEATEYGNKYRISGSLTGPNGHALQVVSIWMTENVTGVTKFITLYPREVRAHGI